MKEGRQDGTDGRGRGKEEEDEGASEEERKEGRREEWQFVCSDPELVLVFVLQLDGRRVAGLWRGERAGCPPGRGRSDN